MLLGAALLLFLLYIAVPVVLRLVSGTPADSVGIGLEVIKRAVVFCILVLAFYLYQRALYDLFHTRVNRRRTWSVIVLSPVILFGMKSVYDSLPSVRVRQILTNGELAPLPESATEITVYTWWTPMSGAEFLRFRASREDIESFVANSPILKRAEYCDYSADKMRLLDQDERRRSRGGDADEHEYIRHDSTAPPWYLEEIKHNAREYRIRPPGYHSSGEVIIDREKDVVYVRLVFS